MRILRRLGVPPRERGSLGNANCPDLFELDDGRFAIIGTDATAELDALLPPDASRGPRGRIVTITREAPLHAKEDIPDR